MPRTVILGTRASLQRSKLALKFFGSTAVPWRVVRDGLPVLSNASAVTFSEQLDHTRALYLAITVFSTVGFGDITSKTDLARTALPERTTPRLGFDASPAGPATPRIARRSGAAGRDGKEHHLVGAPSRPVGRQGR